MAVQGGWYFIEKVAGCTVLGEWHNSCKPDTVERGWHFARGMALYREDAIL